MTKSIILGLACCWLLSSAHSQGKNSYQQASVVKVYRYELPSTYVEDTPIGTPGLPDHYDFEIGFQVVCDLYTGRYESHTESLPSMLAPNRRVQLRVRMHFLYVKGDDSREIEMYMVGRRRMKTQSCTLKR